MYLPSKNEEEAVSPRIIAPYQIVKEIYDKVEHIEVEIVKAMEDIVGIANEVRSNLEPVIKRLDTDDVYPEVRAVDGGNSRGAIRNGWFFGTHGAVLLSNNNPLRVQGDIVSCPASSGETARYLQLRRDENQLNLSTSSVKEANNDCVLFFDGSSIPLGWYAHRGLPDSFNGYSRYPSYEKLVEDVYFGKKGVYRCFFTELTRKPVAFIPKTSVSSFFIQNKLEHYGIPKGTPDVVLLSRVLRENEYLTPIEYCQGLAPRGKVDKDHGFGWAKEFGPESEHILITYFKPTFKSSVFKVEFPKSKDGEIDRILATFKRYYSSTAQQFIPLLLADELATIFSSLEKPIAEVVRTRIIQMLMVKGDRELIESFFRM